MQRDWWFFWAVVLGTVVAFGAWRAAEADYAQATRGHTLATQTRELPHRLPIAGVNVALTAYDDPEAELAAIDALGFTWVRQHFLWSEIEPEPGQYDWAAYDAVVEAIAAYDNLRLVAVINGTPPWARHRSAPGHPFAPPESPAAYGEFAGQLANRYGDIIDHYEIWDEPNIEQAWGNLNPRPALYLAMLEAAYTAIHTADADAMVIAASLAPTVEDGPDNLNEIAYLRALYELGGADSFDAVSGKPYGFNTPPTDREVGIDRLNFSRLILLREEMMRQGDGHKPVWGGNFGWNALPDDWQGPPSIWGSATPQQQIRYTAEAYARALQEWPWAGGLILHHWWPDAPVDDPVQGFALRPNAEAWAAAIPQEDDAIPPGRFPAQTAYATYDGDWTFSDLGADAGPAADQNTITIPFRGDAFALELRRGDYLAYLSVTIDGQPANLLPRNRQGEAFIPLTAAEREPAIDLIPVADDLTVDDHIAVITHRPELGDDRFPIVGFAVGHSPDANRWPANLALALFLGALLLALGLGLRLPWHNLRLPSMRSLRNLGDMLLGLFFSSVVMLGALLTWHETLSTALRRDLPTALTAVATSSLLYFAPSTWLAFFGLIITAIIIFNRPWVGLLQVLFWSAFFSSNLDPFFRALALVDILLTVTVVATLSRIFYDSAKSHTWPRLRDMQLHPLDGLMLALVAVGILSLLWSDLLPTALRHLRIMIIGPALFYALIRLLKPNLRDLAFLVEALLFTGFLLSAIGLATFITEQNIVLTQEGARRLTSVYGSPNSLALYLGRCLPFALAYLALPVSEWRRILALVTGGFMFVAFLLTQSLGGLLLGIPAAIAVMLLAWQGQRMLPVLGALTLGGAIALIPLSMIIPRLQGLLNFENNTSVIRLNLWRSTAELLSDQPITGVGLDQFLYAYRSTYILPENWIDPDLSHPHNILLDYWVQLGVLGLLIGLGLQWFFWRQALQNYRATPHHTAPLRRALIIRAMGSMAYVLAHGLVDMAHFNINLSYVFALLLALIVQLPKTSEDL